MDDGTLLLSSRTLSRLGLRRGGFVVVSCQGIERPFQLKQGEVCEGTAYISRVAQVNLSVCPGDYVSIRNANLPIVSLLTCIGCAANHGRWNQLSCTRS